ncbi:MAG: Wadjet anti-phage system protein JetD domain-containing protein [Saprospiraceae bacterium]
MTSLFTTQPAEAGYRLHRYEVLNWGTFDENIWSIEPGGQNSLLTGANASGKTTLVDGLLTLLVPERRMRFYNQTVGAKGERNEESYVLGEYGETENTETNARETNRLRPKKEEARSVLLAVFRNEDKWVTLAQVRWFVGSELRRAFVFSYKKLGIAEDFLPFSPSDDWKKRIRQRYGKTGAKELVQFFDGPKEYATALRSEFGMRSEKAHTLFSQTIGLKVLGNLDEFVRGQMLEEGDGEAEFQKLRSHFSKLRDAYRAIEKAVEQTRLLSPVRTASEELTRHKLELHTIENHQTALPLWFARRESLLLEHHIAEKEAELRALAERIETLNNQHAALSEAERALDMQIRQDKTGQAISELREKNRQLAVQQADREAEMQRYNAIVAQLDDMAENPDAAIFGVQAKAATARKNRVETQAANLRDQEAPAHTEANEANKAVETLKAELAALRNQKNNITGRVAEIRRELLAATGATEAEIPFIGELLRVRPEAAHWESAIEKLLRSYALQLIVPENHYAQVNHYAHQNNLRGRIVYQRWRPGGSLGGLVTVGEKSVFHKLELRRESPYAEWIEYELKKRFDYVCTDDLAELQRCEKALTSHGLTKNTDRHEKDDRPDRTSRQFYVLGWDNKEKIAALRDALDTAEAAQRVAAQRLVALHKQQDRLQQELANLEKLLFFDSFKKVDWQHVAAEIQENNDRIAALEKADDRVKTLKKQHEDLKRQLESCNEQIKKSETRHLKAEQEIEQKRLAQNRCRETLARSEGRVPEAQLLEFAAALLPDTDLDLHQLGSIQRHIEQQLAQSNRELQEAVRADRTRLERCMSAFKNPAESIARRFEDWRADTHNLSDYLRELTVPVHTKFVEQHKGILTRLLDVLLGERVNVAENSFEQRFHLRYDEPLVRIRLLDAVMPGFRDVSLPVSAFRTAHFPVCRVFVLENKMNFLAFPAVPEAAAIWGKGFQVSILKNIDWLARAEIFYWGDLDAQGLQILSQWRGYYPHTQALLMDRKTLLRFQSDWVAGTPTTATRLPGLSAEEHSLFDFLKENNQRLEQEKIPQDWLMAAL